MKIVWRINEFNTGHDEYTLGWWFHQLLRRLPYRIGYGLWWRLNDTRKFPGWGYRIENITEPMNWKLQ